MMRGVARGKGEGRGGMGDEDEDVKKGGAEGKGGAEHREKQSMNKEHICTKTAMHYHFSFSTIFYGLCNFRR